MVVSLFSCLIKCKSEPHSLFLGLALFFSVSMIFLSFIYESYGSMLMTVWANDKHVQEALHVREGTISSWTRCNESLAYTQDVTSVVDYHRNISTTGLRGLLIYSGDHDISIPTIGTQEWIRSLNMTLEDTWRAWFVDGQVAGYTKKYSNADFHMTYATIKGGGHIAPEYKPKECFLMIDRWFAYYPL